MTEHALSMPQPKIVTIELPYMLEAIGNLWTKRLEKHLKTHGLTCETWRALLAVAQDGPMNIRELSNATLIAHSTIGRWLSRLEERDLVTRRTQPSDQRAVEFSLSPKGQEVFAELEPLATAEYEDMITTFSSQELRTLLQYLERLQAQLMWLDRN